MTHWRVLKLPASLWASVCPFVQGDSLIRWWFETKSHWDVSFSNSLLLLMAGSQDSFGAEVGE